MATVVLLHGFGDDATCWPGLGEALRADGHRVVALDARGHGGHRLPPGGGFTVAEHVADAAAAVQDVLAADRRTRSVVLVGHSMGASTAAVLAGEQPGLVSGVLLEDPPWPALPGPSQGIDLGPGSEVEDWILGLQGTDEAGRLAWVTNEQPEWSADEYVPWARSKAGVDPAVFRVRQSWLGTGWPAAVAALRCPALLVAGDPAAGSHTAEDVDRLVDGRPGWLTVRISGAGHSVRRDARGWYRALCRAFVRAVGETE